MESTHLSENKSIFRRRILEGLKIFLWHSCLYIHCNMVALKTADLRLFSLPPDPWKGLGQQTLSSTYVFLRGPLISDGSLNGNCGALLCRTAAARAACVAGRALCCRLLLLLLLLQLRLLSLLLLQQLLLQLLCV